jgi:hypothetical protein
MNPSAMDSNRAILFRARTNPKVAAPARNNGAKQKSAEKNNRTKVK